MLPDKPADQTEEIVLKTETALQEADPDFEHLVEITGYHIGLWDQLTELKRTLGKSLSDQQSVARPDRDQGGAFDAACRALRQVSVPHAKAAHGSESRRY
ncbi:MAG: hypothetical protein NXH97_16845 [Rhodobacteraceae bacterium]|nr:hypothetical protein [Paracoccaceae bacterium]